MKKKIIILSFLVGLLVTSFAVAALTNGQAFYDKNVRTAFSKTSNDPLRQFIGEVDGLIGGQQTGATTSIADSLAIPITAAIVSKTTGADAEALTIVDGSPGQVLTITLAVDGGGTGT
jgi:hypothetical protein